MASLTKVNFSNLNKILYPDLAIKKSQIIEYYIKAAPLMLDYLKDRPLVITRFPNGINQNGFYGKNAPKGTPSWVETYKKHSKTAKRDLNYIVCNNLDTLLWLANLAALELHMPLSKTDSYEKPDLVLFDIDPEPPANINDAVKVANLLKEILDNLSLKSYPKTSGKKGLHIIVPILPKYSYKQTREFVHQIGKYLTKENEIIVSEFSQSQDPGKVYIDYSQNSVGKTMICPYSLRAEKKAPVSTPLSWEQVTKRLKPQKFNIFSVLETKTNPWNGFWEHKQKLDV
ncbi:MAG: non-homologous end-joining DNA ligase [Candidatus Bathyarchaeota archaeon]|nr:non-homologous end-joining DNA ligase [Candidatus Bathyarchaeum tardum]WGM88901.1 MAG: non-homologous end-joining DNA ligase [Candidatus Bathyarchaeum tardum]